MDFVELESGADTSTSLQARIHVYDVLSDGGFDECYPIKLA